MSLIPGPDRPAQEDLDRAAAAAESIHERWGSWEDVVLEALAALRNQCPDAPADAPHPYHHGVHCGARPKP